jgi:methyl-accepting chemotaxis protein
MKNLTIGMRLALGFGGLMCLMAVILIIAFYTLINQNSNADLTINDTYPKVALVQDTSFLALDTNRQTRNVIINTDEKKLARYKETLEQDIAKINDNLNKLDQMVSTDKERELVNKIKTARTAFAEYTNEIIPPAMKNDKEGAVKALYSEKYKTQAAYFDALREMVDLQEKTMRDGGERTKTVYHQGMTMMIVLGVFALLAGSAVAWLITKKLLKQLGGEPDYAVAISEKIAEGDLSFPIHIQREDNSSLLFSMRAMRDNLARIVGDVREGTESITSASGQIASGNQDLSARTESQASSLEETAASMEQLTSTVKQNAENARQANQMAVSASDVAIKGGSVVSQVVETMSSINDSSKKIVDIIGVIDGIAFQTNILALNAAVEAARAGEQGRGFAVVASEVRNLAQRSAAAAKEIKSLIGDSVDKVEIGTKLVDHAGTTMNEVVASVKRVSDIIGEITSASQEQTSGIDQINIAIIEMDNVTQQNSALVEQAAAAAASMQDQAKKLSHTVSIFKLADQKTQEVQRRNVATPGVPVKKATVNRAVAVAKTAKPAVARLQSETAHQAKEDDWEEF